MHKKQKNEKDKRKRRKKDKRRSRGTSHEQLQLYDKSNRKIGSVREKILNVKMMWDEEMYPADFIIKTGFMNSIELKSILNPSRTEELVVKPYGWHIGGKYISYDYTLVEVCVWQTVHAPLAAASNMRAYCPYCEKPPAQPNRSLDEL